MTSIEIWLAEHHSRLQVQTVAIHPPDLLATDQLPFSQSTRKNYCFPPPQPISITLLNTALHVKLRKIIQASSNKMRGVEWRVGGWCAKGSSERLLRHKTVKG